jgi:hypothetical protein
MSCLTVPADLSAESHALFLLSTAFLPVQMISASKFLPVNHGCQYLPAKYWQKWLRMENN